MKSFITPQLRNEDAPVLYHYCSALAFHSIVTSQRMRFSDINLMNDYLEFHWGYGRFIEAINEIKTHVSEAFYVQIDQIISRLQLHTHPLLACFSESGDVLSQWRAYASDGAGFVLVFAAKFC